MDEVTTHSDTLKERENGLSVSCAYGYEEYEKRPSSYDAKNRIQCIRNEEIEGNSRSAQ